MRPISTPRLLLILSVAAATLMFLPTAGASPAAGAAGTPVGAASPAAPAATPPSPTPASELATTASPAATPPISSAVRPRTTPFEGVPDPSPLPSAPAASAEASYEWQSAYVGYGPPWPPADLMLGEGEGLAVDNALDEFVFFGGLASGGLSNYTWNYEYYYNTSDPLNSTENAFASTSVLNPSARVNMSFDIYQAGGVALMYGGLTNLTTQATANDTWLYYVANDTWVDLGAAGSPPAREEAAFAIDQTDGIGLLFGGVAPNYSSGNVSGTIIWRDTWEFNFHTDRWSWINSTLSPSDRYGSSMVWDPANDVFFLFGGCSFSCDSDTWEFSPSTSEWEPVTATGLEPGARAGASFAWDPGSDRGVLYGGYTFDTNGNYLVYSDTHELLPDGEWLADEPSSSGPAPTFQPGPIYDTPSTWANFPGCDAMPIWGGSPYLAAPPEFVYIILPSNDSPGDFQCWTFGSGPPPPGPPPPCSRQSFLDILVLDAITGRPIPNATVEISGQCLPGILHTDLQGYADFTTNTPDNISINVSAAYYHGKSTYYNYTYYNSTANDTILTRVVQVYLQPFPALNVQVLGNDGGTFYVPVEGAAVELDNFTIVATTDALGWGNATGLSEFNETAIVSATAANYSTNWKVVAIPYTGEVNVTLVLLKAGYLTVLVVDSVSGDPIGGATGTITRLDPGLPAPFRYTTGPDGTYTVELPEGNYSATAGATGYLNNNTGGDGYLGWVAPDKITVKLTPERGSNESVRLQDAFTGAPIAGGYVRFGDGTPIRTGADGWANTTDLLPPGRMLVLGTATGYLPNSTTITVAYLTNLPPLTLNLTPTCDGACAGGGHSGNGPGGSPFLPTGGASLALLLAAPGVLVVAGALYAIGLSARRGVRVREASASEVSGA